MSSTGQSLAEQESPRVGHPQESLVQSSTTIFPQDDDWQPPTREDLRRELRLQHHKDQRKRVWSRYDSDVKECYDTLLKRWQKEMDNLLVFGGLFAAVLTPFNVESYTSLQPDPTDPSLAILQQISTQLNSFSINSGFINSTTPFLPLADIQPTFHASTSAVLINKLWFSSLICTLASSSIALIVKQWLFELSTGLPGDSRSVARRRQYRYNALQKWHVGTIVVIPSLLLQAALILFLSGLLVLLWALHPGVATISTILVGVLFLFLVIVTILPTLTSSCCYGSPQARILYPIPRWILCRVSGTLITFLQGFDASSYSTTITFLYNFLKTWMVRSPTWRSKEDRPILHEANTLDRTTAVMAFTTTLDDEYLQDLCFVLHDLPTTEFPLVFDDIVNALRPYTDMDVEMSCPDDQRHPLARPLTSALQYLLVDVDPLADTGEVAFRCKALLDRLTVMEPIDKNAIMDVVFLITDLCDQSLSQQAYKILFEVLDLKDTGPPPQRLTYRSLRYAMLLLNAEMTQHNPGLRDSYDIAVTHQLRIVRAILHCILDALELDTSLTPAEAHIVCNQGERLILNFQNNWNMLDWQRILGNVPTDDQLNHPQYSLNGNILQFVWKPLRDMRRLRGLQDASREQSERISEIMLNTLTKALELASEARRNIILQSPRLGWEVQQEKSLSGALKALTRDAPEVQVTRLHTP